MLWAENIVARRYFYPACHRMEPYRSMPRYRDLRLPATDAASSRVLCLPTGTAVDIDAIEVVCDVIESAVQHSTEISTPGPAGRFTAQLSSPKMIEYTRVPQP